MYWNFNTFTTQNHAFNAAYVYFALLPTCISPLSPHLEFFETFTWSASNVH